MSLAYALAAPADARAPYHLRLQRAGGRVSFAVEGLTVLDVPDTTPGLAPLADGRLGFRQMAPLIAEYANLVVRSA